MVGDSPAIARLVEKQMRNWEIARGQRHDAAPEPQQEVEQFVAISSALGAGGQEVANLLGERLNWPVFDKQILQAMSGDDALRRRLYESMDQRDQGWFEDQLQALMQGRFSRNDYFHRMVETILSLARQSCAVFLGRAADLILPRSRGLRIRLMAPLDHCVRHYAQQSNLEPEAARKEMERIGLERFEFVRHHFNVNPDDPSRYDVVVNMGTLSNEQAVDLILSAMRIRGVWS